jgi:hypothetical protein
MPRWLHRTKKQQLASVALADLPEPVANYIEEADLSAVAGQPEKYWKITGDVVSLMSPAEQAAVDAALTAAATQERRDSVTTEVDSGSQFEGVRARALLENANQRCNYLVNRVAQLQAAMDAMKATTGAVQNMRDAIPATWLPTNTRDKPTAIQDYKDDVQAGNQDT